MDDLLKTILFAFVTTILGYITSMVSKRYREKSEIEKEKAEKIADAVVAEAETSRARALEALAEKLPPASNVEELIKSLERVSLQLGEIPARDEERRENSSWSVVEDLVQSYHRQALEQAKVQFWFSVVAATVGFAFIIFMVSNVPTTDWQQVLLRALPGTIIDVVAALFFRQASETRERATALYDRLRSDNQKAQALSVVNSIEDTFIRSAVKAQLALHMAGLESPPLDAAALVLQHQNTSRMESKVPKTQPNKSLNRTRN